MMHSLLVGRGKTSGSLAQICCQDTGGRILKGQTGPRFKPGLDRWRAAQSAQDLRIMLHLGKQQQLAMSEFTAICTG